MIYWQLNYQTNYKVQIKQNIMIFIRVNASENLCKLAHTDLVEGFQCEVNGATGLCQGHVLLWHGLNLLHDDIRLLHLCGDVGCLRLQLLQMADDATGTQKWKGQCRVGTNTEHSHMSCCKISNIRHTKSPNSKDSDLVLQLSLSNPAKPGVKPRIKMWLEQRRQAMLQLHLNDQQFYCLLRCALY